MARSPKRLFDPQQLGTSASTLYTCPTNTKCVIRKLSFTNSDAGAVTIDLYLVKSGGSASVTNIIVKDHSIASTETLSVPDVEGQVLEAGDTIQALASKASSVNALGSGTEVT